MTAKTTKATADMAAEKPEIIVDGDKETIQELKVLESELELDLFLFLGDSPYLNTPWVKVLIIFSAFLLVALFVRLVIFVILKKITRNTKSSIDNFIVNKLQKPIFISILLAGIFPALLVLDLPDGALLLIRKLLLTIFLLIWMFTLISIAKMVLSGIAHSNSSWKFITRQTLPLFLNLSVVLILIVFIYMIMSTWNVNMTAFLASAGVMGVAIGFAAKDTLANLISGVLILTDRPYKIGDFVVIEGGATGSQRGEITHIGIRSTRMRTRDDVEVTVPNAIMGNSMVVNESGGPYLKFRIRIQVGVAYGTDIDMVRDTLLKVAGETDNVCEEPAPRVRMRSLGPSSLDFELLCWVPDPVLRGQVTDKLYERVYNEFKLVKIEIPFQQVDLHVRNGKV